MNSGALALSLLAGAGGALFIWLLARKLRMSRDGGPERAPAAPQPPSGPPGTCPEAIANLYRRVLIRRLGGLLFCLLALAAWIADSHWFICLLLAGLGCLLQYFAYRLRTRYVLDLTTHK